MGTASITDTSLYDYGWTEVGTPSSGITATRGIGSGTFTILPPSIREDPTKLGQLSDECSLVVADVKEACFTVTSNIKPCYTISSNQDPEPLIIPDVDIRNADPDAIEILAIHSSKFTTWVVVKRADTTHWLLELIMTPDPRGYVAYVDGVYRQTQILHGIGGGTQGVMLRSMGNFFSLKLMLCVGFQSGGTVYTYDQVTLSYEDEQTIGTYYPMYEETKMYQDLWIDGSSDCGGGESNVDKYMMTSKNMSGQLTDESFALLTSHGWSAGSYTGGKLHWRMDNISGYRGYNKGMVFVLDAVPQNNIIGSYCVYGDTSSSGNVWLNIDERTHGQVCYDQEYLAVGRNYGAQYDWLIRYRRVDDIIGISYTNGETIELFEYGDFTLLEGHFLFVGTVGSRTPYIKQVEIPKKA